MCAGLDIGADRIRLAVLRRRRGRLRLELLAEHAFGQVICNDGRIDDFELLAHGCRRLMRQHMIHAGAVAMAIPAATVTLTPLVLPASSNELQRLAQVRAEAAAHRRQSLDELALDYRVLGPAPASPADVQVLAVTAPAMLVEDRLALAEALGLQARAVVADGWSLATFLRDGDGAAVLHLDAASAWLSRHAQHWQALAWRSDGAPITALLEELAPLLRPSPPRLLLSGDAAALNPVAAALRKYAGIPAAVAALPPRILVAGHVAAAIAPRRLPAFHCAVALAGEGLM
ncbi:pilus assembly protein PilM [Herbaspirillum sp. SJZ099]|uniref:pilus assembly protein PilM n=1 Tax=Herbaspirillum sp. SJZ099 TaxID=2572916 RepID=UPI00119D86A6|nr:pilus assembly protein PilM [Herbaspirillum sp. SJZ099]TWC69839.1 type IV pilus assembly PilM-like protein [Herbaspirillum sp. SJZ099]